MNTIEFKKMLGRTYEDVYSGWLGAFKEVAESKVPIRVVGAPHVWTPLMLYLGADVVKPEPHFPCDEWWTGAGITAAWRVAKANNEARDFVEHACSCRPELVDALWRADRVWHTYSPFSAPTGSDFVVASVNAFDRPEIKEYEKKLTAYRPSPSIKRCVITNCAADKPYPAPLHKAISERLPDPSWHMVTATGVLGILPEELWADAPYYDSGWPNFERLRAVATDYFRRTRYERVVVYTDLYAPVIAEALGALRVPAAFPLDLKWRTGYLPLTEPVLLERLEHALAEPVKEITP